MIQINWVAILLSAIATMIVGSLWYSPKLFGAMWMKLEGITQKDMESAKKEMPKMYAGMFIASLVMAYVLAKFIGMSSMPSLSTGVMVGFWAWLGFYVTSMLSMNLASSRPMKLFFIHAGYYLLVLLIVGAILGGMH